MQPIYRRPLTFVEPLIPRTPRAIGAVGAVVVVALAALAGLIYFRRTPVNTPPVEPVKPPPLEPLNLKDPRTISYALSKLETSPRRMDLETVFFVNEHPYQACGSLSYINAHRGQEGAKAIPRLLGEFFEKVKALPFKVILMSEQEMHREAWLPSVDDFKSHYTSYLITDLSDQMRELEISFVLRKAKEIADAVAKDSPPVFVHCIEGTERTSAFIAALELYRTPEILKQDPEAIRQFLYNTLCQIGHTCFGRYPSPKLIETLFSDQFIVVAKRVQDRGI